MARATPIQRRRRPTYLALLYLTALPTLTTAQATTYYFSGAVQVTGASSESAAVQAQCPSDHPISCTNIQEPGYCCPSGNTCAWSNSQVACCPSGQTCSGSIGGAAGYSPTSWYQSTTAYWQPTTTYYTPTTTYYQGGGATTVGGGGVVVPAGYTTAQGETTVDQQTTAQGDYGNGQYCSTLVEVGPNLPTTAQGECGTILVVEPAEAARLALGWARLGGMVVGLHALGSLLLMRR